MGHSAGAEFRALQGQCALVSLCASHSMVGLLHRASLRQGRHTHPDYACLQPLLQGC